MGIRNWFKQAGSAGPGKSDAAGVAHDYPPRVPPHSGNPWELSSVERQANLDWFLDTRASRLAGLRAWLVSREPSAGAVLDAFLDPATDVAAGAAMFEEAVAAALGRGATLPPRDGANIDWGRFHGQPATGRWATFALGADIGLAMGEAIAGRRAALGWEMIADDVPVASLDRHQVALARRDSAGALVSGPYAMLSVGLQSLYDLVPRPEDAPPSWAETMTAILAADDLA